MHSPHQIRLDKALRALTKAGVVPAAGHAFEQQADIIRAELRQTVIDEIPAFSASGNPDILPELGEHSAQHVREMQRLLGGARVGEFDYVREHAKRRSAQRFPLEATLHAYRCGHKVLARWIREVALATADESASVGETLAAVADFSIEYTDSVSTIATSEYVLNTRLLAEAEGDRRTELLGVLLDGYDESDGRVANLLRGAGFLDQRQSFCVAVAQSVDPAEMENPARARRLAESLDRIVHSASIRSLIGVRDDKVTIVFSDTRRVSGWTVPRITLAQRIQPHLLKVGIAVLIGTSTDVPSTSHIPKAHSEAKIALEFADVSHRLVHFSDIPIRRVLLRLGHDKIRSALPTWSSDLFAADDKARGSLTSTLRAYADADMNVLQAAKNLSVHPNTIYSRMQKISDVTGLNGLGYHALTELLLAADCRP